MLLLCSEPHHVRGESIRGCRMCSMPVCEACIIKSSFGKWDERTFSNRTRSLCPDCYDLGNVHAPSHLNPGEPLCICTAKDGHLCIECKTKQKCHADENLNQCHGEGCSRTKEGGFAGRVCLWCDRRLSSENNRATARRDYDLRHLLARSHSMYEHSSDDNIVDLASPASHTPYKVKARPRDPIEEERQRLLSKISARRSLTADAAEEERWRRSESLRRSETFKPPPPIRRQRTTPAMNSRDWRDTDSVAPTLVERDYWEASDPPEYSLDIHRPDPEQEQALAGGQVLSYVPRCKQIATRAGF